MRKPPSNHFNKICLKCIRKDQTFQITQQLLRNVFILYSRFLLALRDHLQRMHKHHDMQGISPMRATCIQFYYNPSGSCLLLITPKMVLIKLYLSQPSCSEKLKVSVIFKQIIRNKVDEPGENNKLSLIMLFFAQNVVGTRYGMVNFDTWFLGCISFYCTQICNLPIRSYICYPDVL